MVNTGAVVTTAGAFFTAIATILVGWFVRRGDRSAKIAQQYFDDASFNMALVGALRDDYWGLADWAGSARNKWHRLLVGLPMVCDGNKEELAKLFNDIGDLPELPVPAHRALEREHARRTKPKDDE